MYFRSVNTKEASLEYICAYYPNFGLQLPDSDLKVTVEHKYNPSKKKILQNYTADKC